MRKDLADLCFLAAWHRNSNVICDLGEYYYRRYGDYEKGGELSDFVLGLYWLSKARDAGFFIAYIWLVRMIDAYFTSYNHSGYQSLAIKQLKSENKTLCEYLCDEKPIDIKIDDLENVNLAQFFLNDSSSFGIEYTLRMRNSYIAIASEHGYDCVDEYDRGE